MEKRLFVINIQNTLLGVLDSYFSVDCPLENCTIRRYKPNSFLWSFESEVHNLKGFFFDIPAIFVRSSQINYKQRIFLIKKNSRAKINFGLTLGDVELSFNVNNNDLSNKSAKLEQVKKLPPLVKIFEQYFTNTFAISKRNLIYILDPMLVLKSINQPSTANRSINQQLTAGVS